MSSKSTRLATIPDSRFIAPTVECLQHVINKIGKGHVEASRRLNNTHPLITATIHLNHDLEKIRTSLNR